MRSYNRNHRELRPISFETGYTRNADGSVLVCYGETKVLCTASMEDRVPPFLKNKGVGWVTAEYGMLPGATHTRGAREAMKGRQSGRTQEIQRLIGRSLRMCVNTGDLGERTIIVDCDVLQADGGTRTAAVTGGCAALILCLWEHRKKFIQPPVTARVAAVSLGLNFGQVFLDLDYSEDANMGVDLNLVLTHLGEIVEIQGTAERQAFKPQQLQEIVATGAEAIESIFHLQRKALSEAGVKQTWIP